MQCLKKSIGRLQFVSFFESQSNDYRDDFTFIKDLHKSLAEKNKQNKPLELIEDFN